MLRIEAEGSWGSPKQEAPIDMWVVSSHLHSKALRAEQLRMTGFIAALVALLRVTSITSRVQKPT